MRMAIAGRRGGLVGLAMLIGLLLPVMASAQASPVGKANVEQDLVAAVDIGAGTIVLGAETFAVSTRSELLDAGGRPIGLNELTAASSGLDGDMVEFTATRKRKGGLRTIRQLQVVEGDFE